MSTKISPARIRSTLKARQMFLLVALYESGTLNLAADATCMSTPAASKMLKDIEDMFGVQLFDRLPRGLKPTIYGTTLIRHVKMALANLDNGAQSITALREGISGQVRIGSIITVALTLIPQAIMLTKQESPKLTIGVDVGSTSKELIGGLRRDETDFLIARIPEHEDDSDLLYDDIYEEKECVVSRKGHPLLSHAQLTLSDVVNEGWILTPRSGILRNRVDNMFKSAGLEIPTNVIESTSMSLILSLLQETDYLHVIPIDLARYYEQIGALAIVPIDIPFSMMNFGIITRRDVALSPGAERFLENIRGVARKLYR